jgi:hypothetical protein
VSGSVKGPGDPAAVAGAPVKLMGFGPDADAAEVNAESIDHEITPDVGWIMTTTLEAKAE